MVCERITLPNGARGFVCGPRRRTKKCACGSGLPATQLCDWKTPDGPKPTCDAPLCRRCTSVPAPDKDLCPTHAEEWRARQP